MRHIHTWVPFLNYKPLIQRGRELGDKLKNEPIEFVKNAMVCVVVLLAIHSLWLIDRIIVL